MVLGIIEQTIGARESLLGKKRLSAIILDF